MRKALLPLSLPLLLPLCFSCGGNEGDNKPVELCFGTVIGMDAPIEGVSHLTEADTAKINSLIDAKKSFILIVKDTSDGCVCWSSWHDEILAPYIKRNKLLVYLTSLADFKAVENSDKIGLKLYSGSATMGIFQEGALKFQNDTHDLKSDWVNSAAFFTNWMDTRVKKPKIFRIEEAGLSKLYEGNQAFTVYFGRDKCGDCAFFDSNTLIPYLKENDNLSQNFYYIDCDAWRDGLDKDAYAAKKAEFGLAYSEDNEAGYGAGAFPTLYYVHPDGTGTKTGDVIELAAVFFNEGLDESMKVTDSYFTSARYEASTSSDVHFLEYTSKVQTKVLEGMALQIEGYASMTPLQKATARKETLKQYENPLASAFLDFAVGNK